MDEQLSDRSGPKKYSRFPNEMFKKKKKKRLKTEHKFWNKIESKMLFSELQFL